MLTHTVGQRWGGLLGEYVMANWSKMQWLIIRDVVASVHSFSEMWWIIDRKCEGSLDKFVMAHL